ncbi:MAG: molybdate ABC transporter substrate-binding protein [Armatimonadetes bacterium CG_4_9_14_3_um_filter_58_7]|nr:MAG: molybdate ABC transporter substrate-binding protein [Armatimonadetes bacterium CG_4_9_14_3_um_filter_58_7]
MVEDERHSPRMLGGERGVGSVGIGGDSTMNVAHRHAVRSALPILAMGALALTAGCTSRRPTLPEPAGAHGEVTVFVPCGMLGPMMKIRKAFEAQPGNPKVKLPNDNAVVLMRRIRRGEASDILLTPGETEMNLMVAEGFIDREDASVFGTFRMILVVPKENKAGIKSVADLADKRVRRVAIADPAQNSVGYYAQESMKSLKLWDAVEPKLVTHWHALEAVTYVCKGRVDAGLYFDACPFESTPSELSGYENAYKVIEILPESSHPVVKVQAGILKKASNPDGARQLISFMLTAEGQKILQKNGIPNPREIPVSGD